MKEFSRTWKSSRNIGKQRKYLANAMLHIRSKQMTSMVSKEIEKKYKIKHLRIRKGDTVKIMRGQYKKKTGKIDKVSLKSYRVYITGIERQKRDGSKSMYPIHPSKIMITECSFDDKKRRKVLERNNKTQGVKNG